MIRKYLAAFAVLAFVGCAVAPVTPSSAGAANDPATLKADAIYHVEQIKTLGARQQTEIAQARADILTFQNSAAAWESEYHALEDSFPYQLGYWQCVLAKWWVMALVIAFIARMIVTVWPGGLFGEYLAHLFTAILAVLTCFLTYLANIPDNIFFRRALAAKDAQIAALQSQLQAASPATIVPVGGYGEGALTPPPGGNE